MLQVSENFKTRVHELYGHQGDIWLQQLPELLDRCEERFDVRFHEPFNNLSWNLILKAQKADGQRVVVKIAVAKEDLSRELRALNVYDRRGGVHIIDADVNVGAVVMERVEPGTPLSTIDDDDAATKVFCHVFENLHRSKATAVNSFPSIRDHFRALDLYCNRFANKDLSGPLPVYWVQRATACFNDLTSSTVERVLLHGDLHHDNILHSQEHGWVAIDPKGIVGDRHFDVIQYLLNYEDRGGDAQTVLNRRIAIISDTLGLDSRRIIMWGIARGVLEACWTLENGRDDWDRGIQIAQRFAKCSADKANCSGAYTKL